MWSEGLSQHIRESKARYNRQGGCSWEVSRVSGFTLLEIMIALAVISISFVALLGLRNRDLALAAYSRHITEATLLGRQRVTEISAEGFPELGIIEGDFGESHPDFRWKQEVRQTMFEVVRELVLSVTWKEGRRTEEAQFTVYLFNA